MIPLISHVPESAPTKRRIKIAPVIDLIFEENIDYSLIRETIYEILTCNLNIHNCLYEINKILFKRISKQNTRRAKMIATKITQTY